MVFCRACGKEIHETAFNCPGCGAVQPQQRSKKEGAGTFWLPIPSLVCGVVVFLALFDDSAWDEDAYAGAFLVMGVAIILGAISIATQEKGRGMAVAGIVLGIIGALGVLSHLS